MNGFVTVTGTALGAVASYFCQTGYTLHGSGIRQCLSTGQWSLVEPTCGSESGGGRKERRKEERREGR